MTNFRMILKKQSGFSFMEALVSIFIFAVGITAVFSLLQNTLSYNSQNAYRLTGAYLAQEGIEIVRGIRDNNWLAARSDPLIKWDDGINGVREADYLSTVLDASAGRNLKIGNGYYNYTVGTDTTFTREITIFGEADLTVPPDGENDTLKVSVLVTWVFKGKEYSIQAQENLYNWQ